MSSRGRHALAGAAALLVLLGLCAPAQAAYLYVANSTAPGTISQFAVAADGSLSPLSPASVPSVPSGAGATGIAVSPDGRNVLAGNFNAGNVARFTVNANGTLSSGPVQTLVLTAAQGVTYSPDGRSAYATRAQNPGQIAGYDVAADGTLSPKTPATTGSLFTPGAVVFNAAGTRLYSGLNSSVGVAQFSVAGDGTLTALSPATVASGGNQSRITALSPDGTSLYAPNSGSTSVSQFSVAADGTLSLTATYDAGGSPRGVAVSPDGTSVYVANSANAENGNSISQYTRAADGSLTPKSPATVASGSTGTNAITVSSDGHSAYATNQTSNVVSQFTIESDGRLTPKTPLTVTAAQGANQLVFSDGPTLAPTATTGAVSGVTSSGASVAGTVNPHRAATNYTVEYGPSLSFGQISPVAGAGAGSADVPVTAALSGLQPNTTYYVRLVATNALGTQFGAVSAFRTSAAPVPFAIDPDSPTQTNDPITAMAQVGDRTYIAGSFTRVGVPTGYGASLSPGAGTADYSVAKPNGYVYASVSDGAGGWYIGGDFTKVGDIPRSHIAHLLANGSVDPAFDPNMGSTSISTRSSDVRALALDGTTLYAGGDFNRVGSGAATVARNFLAAIDTASGLPTSFDAHLTENSESQFVESLAVSGSRVWAGGTLFADPRYKNLVAVDKTTGAVDPISEQISVTPGYPQVLVPHAGRLYIGGAFNAINGVTRNRLAAIDLATGSLDTTFNPNVNSAVAGIEFFGGKLYAGGNFTSVNGGVPRTGLAALDPDTGIVDPAFRRDLTGWFGAVTQIVTATALSGSTMYVAGNFATVDGTITRHNLAAIDLSTGTVTAFDPNVDRPALTLAVDGSRVYAGGFFTFAGPESVAPGVAVLKPDGTLDPTFSSGMSPTIPITSMVVSGGRVYLGASSNLIIGGVGRGEVVALDAETGAYLPSLAPAVSGIVDTIALAGGKLYVGGQFEAVNGVPRSNLVALDPMTGAVDPAFVPNPDSRVFSLLAAGGKLYAGGRFDAIGGGTHRRIAAVDPATGVADPAFTASSTFGEVLALARSGDTLYIGGTFVGINGADRNYLAALDATTGSLHEGFDPPFFGSVRAFALEGDVLYAGGAGRALDATTGAPIASPVPAAGSANALVITPTHLYTGGGSVEVNGKQQLNLARYPRVAQSPPAVGTGPASAVTGTSADVEGQVNPKGQPTVFTVEYGTTLSFGAISPVVALDDADAVETVSASLSGLTAGTTYYYRVIATNPSGTTTGGVQSFTTIAPAAAPSVTTGVAVSVTATGATLTGTVDSHGAPTAFTFEYGPTNAFGFITAVDSAGAGSGPQSVSLPVTGLAPGTKVRYRIVATNATGTSAGSVGEFTTPGGA